MRHAEGSRFVATLLVALQGCTCAAGTAPVALAPTAAPPHAPAAPVPPGPWAIRFARSCSEWEYSDLLATDTHVFACAHAVYDARSGALVDVRRGLLSALAAAGARSVWQLQTREGDTPVVRDADLSVHEIEAPERLAAAATSPDGARVIAAGYRGAYEIDPAARRAAPVPGGEACGDALGLGWTRDGRAQCLVRSGEHAALVTLGSDGAATHELTRSYLAGRWDPRGGALVAWTPTTLAFLDETGEVLAEGPIEGTDHGDQGALDVSRDGAVLVATGERTELWAREGDSVVVEPVLDRLATRGAFAGEMIVLELPSRASVWMHRGPALALPPLPAPEPPAGYRALAPAMEGDDPTFESEGTILNRDLGDVVAFSGDHAHVVVSRTDAAELARFTEDAAWARMVAARYVERGSERWAWFFRDAEGRRVVLGHAYIGGCERTHIDVRIVEQDRVLERWRVYTSDREDVDLLLGERPASAVEIESARSDTYEGDPSIGEL